VTDDSDDRPTPAPSPAFDESFATGLVGRTLLVGITEQDHTGRLLRRHQVFGVVTKAVRDYGICVKRNDDGGEAWFPPDTRNIKLAGPGDYRNRTTGEVVRNPDYTASWVFTGPMPKD
jgi:hypothetical protein